MTKPNLFVPGAAKSGTSSLHVYLNMHPDIYMSENKEPHFFSHDQRYNEEKDEYYGYFQPGKDAKYRGESSTGYMVFDNVVERIKSDIENPKFIFVLRNPIERIFSHYNWVNSLVGEKLDFRTAILKDKDDQPDYTVRFEYGFRFYYQYGLYAKYIKQYYENFGAENILIILTEDLKKDPLKEVNKCFNFLGLSSLESIDTVKTNSTVNYSNAVLYHRINKVFNYSTAFKGLEKILSPKMVTKLKEFKWGMMKALNSKFRVETNSGLSETDRAWLKNLYEQDVAQLKELTQMDFTPWKDFE